MKILNSIKKDEIVNAVTRTASKYGYRLKKASPTIMIISAAVCGVTATVMACKATIKAQDIIEEHKADVATIHKAKEQIENGQIILNKDETYTEEDVKKDITAVYIQTGVKLAKAYAPAVSLGAIALGCMFGSHTIMSKRNATSRLPTSLWTRPSTSTSPALPSASATVSSMSSSTISKQLKSSPLRRRMMAPRRSSKSTKTLPPSMRALTVSCSTRASIHGSPMQT